MTSPKNKSTENFEIKKTSIDRKIEKICKTIEIQKTLFWIIIICVPLFFTALFVFLYILFSILSG
jgi:hypothetical protein